MKSVSRVALLLAALVPALALAHGVAGGDAAYVASSRGVNVFPFMYLGAKHMVTGYDHLLFLAGVIFFLYRLKDVALYADVEQRLRTCCAELGLTVQRWLPSPITGGDGNREFFVWATRAPTANT